MHAASRLVARKRSSQLGVYLSPGGVRTLSSTLAVKSGSDALSRVDQVLPLWFRSHTQPICDIASGVIFSTFCLPTLVISSVLTG